MTFTTRIEPPPPCSSGWCGNLAQFGKSVCRNCDAEKQYELVKASKPTLKDKLLSIADKYPQYYKNVSHMSHVDVYAVHKLFNIQDPSGAIQHASKKLLLSGVRTGGKTVLEDIKEARDTLNRWLELHQD
jgi:hypothetical protein